MQLQHWRTLAVVMLYEQAVREREQLCSNSLILKMTTGFTEEILSVYWIGLDCVTLHGLELVCLYDDAQLQHQLWSALQKGGQ